MDQKKKQKEQRKKFFLRILTFLSLAANAFLLLFLFSPALSAIHAFLEVQPRITPAGAIVLLSSGHYTDEIFEQASYQRMLHAADLYHRGMAPKIIVCGGILRQGSDPVSLLMARFLVRLGVRESDITTETSSQDTRENLLFSKKIMTHQGVKNGLLVTSCSHMRRSLAVARRLDMELNPAPVPCYEKDIVHPLARSRFIAETLRELGALVYFSLRGWI